LAGPRRARSSSSAKDRALLLLGVRWRSRDELRRRLLQAGFEAEEVQTALADLERSGLIDDARFAREVVRDQAGRKLSGDRAVRAALRQKGVAPEEVERALEAAGDEPERALALAVRRVGRSRSPDPEAEFRRIYGLLIRRG